MSQFITLVVRDPGNEVGKSCVQQAIQLLKPYTTAMSLEDEMTLLDCILQHPDFPDHIKDEARVEADRLCAKTESPSTDFSTTKEQLA